MAAVVVVVVVSAAGAAMAVPVERPVDGLTRYVAGLRVAAQRAQEARAATARLSGTACAPFRVAAGRLVAAASAAEAAFDAYRKANTRYGTQEEIRLIAEVAMDLREARGRLARAAGETAVASRSQQRAAEREVSLFERFLAVKIEDRLGVAGLSDVLTSRSFAQVKKVVVSELQQRLRVRAEAELKRLVGLRIRLNVPLKQQIRDFLEQELSATLSKLAVAAGPAGIVVSLLGRKLVSLVGAKLKEALRNKGDLAPRTRRTVTGFAKLQQQLRSLPKDATLDQVRGVVRRAERALAATAFLKGDLRRAGNQQLLAELRAAETKLARTLQVQRLRFLLDSDLLGADFRIAIRYAASVRADARRLTDKLGCQTSARSDFSGVYRTNFGGMVLKQTGNRVTGCYTHDQGTLTGTVSGKVLSGTWKEAPHKSDTDRGGLIFTRTSSGFTGRWNYDGDGGLAKLEQSGSSGGSWTGTMTGGDPPCTP